VAVVLEEAAATVVVVAAVITAALERGHTEDPAKVSFPNNTYVIYNGFFFIA